jgi:sterol desaturase/sphingolipid hydroxylase (fatty acid hydroxylase superfamily)
MTLSEFGANLGVYLLILGFIIGFGGLIENLFAAELGQSRAEHYREYAILIANAAIRTALAPLLGIAVILIVSVSAHPIIRFRSDGLWFGLSLVLWLLVIDFWFYWAHRAQHAISFLWALHSFHHSAVAITVTTAERHTWVETLLVKLAPWPLLGFLFDVPVDLLLTAEMIRDVHIIAAHSNTRFSFGRLWWLIASPQYHRLHHSRDSAHLGINFCGMFPIWDKVFHTLLRPIPGQFPVTGLNDGDTARNIAEGLIWPIRNFLRNDQLIER